MSPEGVDAVTYKKGGIMRYALWLLAIVCIGLSIFVFINMVKDTTSAAAPRGYKFAIVDNVTNKEIRTTYYIYDSRIIVENANVGGDISGRDALVYDNIDTSSLAYSDVDAEESAECESLDNCATNKKLIAKAKKLISHRASREYTGY